MVLIAIGIVIAQLTVIVGSYQMGSAMRHQLIYNEAVDYDDWRTQHAVSFINIALKDFPQLACVFKDKQAITYPSIIEFYKALEKERLLMVDKKIKDLNCNQGGN
jgi:hypothetical protein